MATAATPLSEPPIAGKGVRVRERVGRIGRAHLVALHRYAGLLMAAFLAIAAITGSALAFRDDLDAWLAPELFIAASPASAPVLGAFELRERVQRQVEPQGRVDTVVLGLHAGRTARFPVAPNPDGQTGEFHVLDYDEVFVDPHTGQIQGKRAREAIAFSSQQIVPLLYKVHHSLALPGLWGTVLLGIISLIWTLDCFIGAYLTFPKGRPFMPKWKTSWLLKWRAGAYRATLDLHRAGGLWLWGVLLLFAWSSVMFNLREPVFRPVMGMVLPFDDSWRTVPLRAKPVLSPQLDWKAAREAAWHAMHDMATETGFTVDWEERLQLDRRRGVYAYMVHSTADLRSEVGNTALLIDADTGAPLGRWLPTGGPAGNTVSNWMGALHMAQVFGRPYQVFVCVLGIAVLGLVVTGLMIWAKKRRARSMAR